MKNIIAYSYGCIMVPLPDDLAQKVRDYGLEIPDEDIYDDGDEHGREEDPHTTLKYGLHTDNPDDVGAVLSNEPPPTIKLGRISSFHNEDYVVLKIGVLSPELHRLNDIVSKELECTDSFPNYKPHITIAYLKHHPKDPYYYQKYYGDHFKGDKFELEEVLFSTADDDDYMIPLTGSKSLAASKVAMAYRLAGRFIDAI